MKSLLSILIMAMTTFAHAYSIDDSMVRVGEFNPMSKIEIKRKVPAPARIPNLYKLSLVHYGVVTYSMSDATADDGKRFDYIHVGGNIHQLFPYIQLDDQSYDKTSRVMNIQTEVGVLGFQIENSTHKLIINCLETIGAAQTIDITLSPDKTRIEKMVFPSQC